VLPRRPLGIRPIVRGEAIALSGFSDRIGLGDIAEIKENPDIVMRVKSNLPLLWRGKAFDFYTGKGWIVYSNPTVSHQKEGNLISLPTFNPSGKIARQEYYINHYNQRIIFAAYKPESIDFPFRYIREDDLETLYSPLNLTYNLNYIVMSRVPDVSPVSLRGAGKDYPEAIRARYLQLPEISGRVKDLIGDIAGRYDNAYDKANAIMNYLRANYGYTLNPKGSRAEESVEDFLFNLKEGHCGYYATSMAVGLRLVGVPCRIINGFGTGEYNRVGDYYIVRQKDAHSWVEAHFPGYGWVTFDPTPPDTSGLGLDRGFWARTSFYLDAMEMKWQQYVVAFSYTEQMGIYKGIKMAYLTLKEQIKNLPFKWLLIGLIMSIIFTAAILLLSPLNPTFSHKWRRRKDEGRGKGEGFYARLLKILERKGFHKLESITPYEFACSIINCDNIVRDSIMDLTDIFYQVRFGSKSLNDDMQKRIKDGFNIVKRWRRG
jgi:transglutaminase-like putative cysteine protease